MEATVIIYKRPSRRVLNTGAAEMPLNDRGRYQLREGTPLTVLFVQVPKAGIEMQVNLQMQIYVDFKTLQRHGTTISAMQKD